jgi:hypothetical protein
VIKRWNPWETLVFATSSVTYSTSVSDWIESKLESH